MSQQSKELVDRMKRETERRPENWATPMLKEAAARIEHLERCREELRSALSDLMNYEQDINDLHALGRFDRARAALSRCAPEVKP